MRETGGGMSTLWEAGDRALVSNDFGEGRAEITRVYFTVDEHGKPGHMAVDAVDDCGRDYIRYPAARLRRLGCRYRVRDRCPKCGADLCPECGVCKACEGGAGDEV